MEIYLGTQGWSYKDWVGPLYPPGSRQQDYLSLYARHFNAVELDTTFYGVPRPDAVSKWNEATPEDFRFTAKLPRLITHDKRLIDCDDDVDEFVAALQPLSHKLGPLLIQLPPDFRSDERPALSTFLTRLPSGFEYAVELRHRSWLSDETAELLAANHVAWANIDLSYMPLQLHVTAPFVYVRWLGDRRQIERMNEVQIDRRERLDQWAEWLEEAALRVQRVYGFVNNHYSGHSPADVCYLQRKLGVPESSPDSDRQQRLPL